MVEDSDGGVDWDFDAYCILDVIMRPSDSSSW